MSNQQAPVSKEVQENKRIRSEFNISESRAWIELTEIFGKKLLLVELVQIVKQVKEIINIDVPRIATRYKTPCVKFLDDNWDRIKPIISQVVLIRKDDGENENGANQKLPNHGKRSHVKAQANRQQMQKQNAQLQQPIVQSQQNVEELLPDMEQLQELQQQEQSMQNEFSTQNTVHCISYDIFDPNSEIILNSRDAEIQDLQSNEPITGDFWSDDSDTDQINFNNTFDDFSYSD